MKKIITLTLVAIMAFLLTGCKKDNKQEEFSLVGTTWAGETSTNKYYVFKFLSNKEVEYTRRHNSPNGEISGEVRIGTYEFNYPNLMIEIPTSSDSYTTWDCEFIDENTYRAYDYYDHLIEFHKQL